MAKLEDATPCLGGGPHNNAVREGSSPSPTAMKKEFVIFNFSAGLFFDIDKWNWYTDQHQVRGFISREAAEGALEEKRIPNLRSDHNYTILTFYKLRDA